MYSHRNGETNPPTVGGRFWFSGHRTNHAGNRARIMDMVEADGLGGIYDDDGAHNATKYQGQWWGPVIAPWELEQKS